MDWSQIVNVSFQGVLVLFTGVLAFATIALWRSTSRYADATKEMARSTELYVNISEELLRAERLDVVNRIHDRIYDEAGLKREYTLNNLAGSTSSAVSHDVAARRKNEFNAKFYRVYRELVGEMLDDALKELPQRDAE